MQIITIGIEVLSALAALIGTFFGFKFFRSQKEQDRYNYDRYGTLVLYSYGVGIALLFVLMFLRTVVKW